MGARFAAVAAVAVLILVGFGVAWASDPAGTDPNDLVVLPVPSFSPAGVAPSVATPPRSTLLPVDCADVLPGPTDMAALLGAPTGSVGVRTVLGVPSPQVGQLERLTCHYQAPGRPGPALVLTLTAFTDAGAAAVQRDRNVAAERSDTRATRTAPLGTARATLLTQAGRRMLMVAHDRFTLTESLTAGVVPDAATEPVLTDLAQRVLPALGPRRQTY